MPEIVFDVQYATAPPKDTKATKAIKKHYGFIPKKESIVLATGQSLNVNPGEIVLFCGPSGSGKTSLLLDAAGQLKAEHIVTSGRSVDHSFYIDEHAVIDNLTEGSIKERFALLSKCGLSDVPLTLSSPAVLSDGQKYRFGLAKAINAGHTVLCADEWCANLDRACAKALCFNVRKLVNKKKLILLVATTHEDIIHDLQPDYIVSPFVGSPPRLIRRAKSKDLVASWKRSRFKKELLKPGTTSLGGIIEIINADLPF